MDGWEVRGLQTFKPGKSFAGLRLDEREHMEDGEYVALAIVVAVVPCTETSHCVKLLNLTSWR